MASSTECLQIFGAVVVSVLVFMVNHEARRCATSLARCFLVSAVGLYAALPYWIVLSGMIVFSAYGRIVALAGAVAANVLTVLRYFVRFAAMMAAKSYAVLVPSANLLSIGSIAAFDRAKHILTLSKCSSAHAIHAGIIPIEAA